MREGFYGIFSQLTQYFFKTVCSVNLIPERQRVQVIAYLSFEIRMLTACHRRTNDQIRLTAVTEQQYIYEGRYTHEQSGLLLLQKPLKGCALICPELKPDIGAPMPLHRWTATVCRQFQHRKLTREAR